MIVRVTFKGNTWRYANCYQDKNIKSNDVIHATITKFSHKTPDKTREMHQENKTKLHLAYISRSMSALGNNLLSCMHTIRSLIRRVSRSTMLHSKATGFRKSIKHDEQQLFPP